MNKKEIATQIVFLVLLLEILIILYYTPLGA